MNQTPSSYQDAVFNALDTYFNQRTKDLRLDKTVTAIVKKSLGVYGGLARYQVQYNGGLIEATATDTNATYIPNTSVYVMIPEGNFSNEKFIIGRASQLQSDRESAIVAATANKFSILGSNLLEGLNNISIKDQIYGVHSYHDKVEEITNPNSKQHREYLIYKYPTQKKQTILNEEYQPININNQFTFNEENIDILKENATAIMFRANFQTNLDSAQRNNSTGRYYLRFDLAFTNLNAGYGETQGEIFDAIKNTVKGKVTEYDYNYINGVFTSTAATEERTLSYYDDKLFTSMQDVWDSIQDSSDTTKLNEIAEWFEDDIGLLDQLYNYVTALYETFKLSKDNIDIIKNTVAAYINLLIDLKNKKYYLDQNDGKRIAFEQLMNEYVAWRNEKIGNDEFKIISYYLSSDKMLGNPYAFGAWTLQDSAYSVDLSDFHHLDAIYFIKEGFIENASLEHDWPYSNPGTPDIKVKNLQIYAMKDLDAQSGDYTLKVEPTGGNNLILTEDEEGILSSTEIQATVMRKLIENLTSNSHMFFYWFKEDPTITSLTANVNDGYNYLAGVGWRQLSVNSGSKFKTTIEDNPAYKNNYKCIAIYDLEDGDVVLSTTFSIYNKDAGLEILLDSDLGTEFAFDAGIPTVTVELKAKNEEEFSEPITSYINDEPKYKFIWAVQDIGNKEMLFLNEASNTDSWMSMYNGLISRTEKYWKQESDIPGEYEVEPLPDGYSSEYATRIQYPVSALSSGFTVTCYVQEYKYKSGGEYRYVNMGSADLEFINRTDGVASDYFISITNGDQVFQYDEYGNAPTVAKFKEPLEVLPLQCKLYSPSGIEIQGTNYEVEWIFELENTLIIPTVDLTENPKTGLIQMYKGHECSFNIADLYNPSAYNNQITCHVTFKDKQIYKDTNFYFGKQGSNGTNGTDVVAKIVPTPIYDTIILHNQPLIAYIQNNQVMFNSFDSGIFGMSNTKTIVGYGNDFSDPIGVLDVQLYKKNERIDPSSYKYGYPRWNLAGNASQYQNKKGKYFVLDKHMFDSDNSYSGLTFDPKVNDSSLYNLQNIKAEVKLDTGETYYAYFSLPIIEYTNLTKSINRLLPSNRIGIDRATYLNEIVYNADGRNPVYNHNAGLKLINIPLSVNRIVFTCCGGGMEDKTAQTKPCFSLLEERDNQDKKATEQIIMTQFENQEAMVYVLPNDNYNGSMTNNHIKATLYSNNNLIATVYAPINMTLNTFGLASLNAWDGNTVAIDEDEGYIMAPQIGAGEKDDNNRFTGILMGKTETYTGAGENAKETGLFGYAHGLQSIYLDSNTGNAIFGLPDGYIFDEINNIPVPAKSDNNYNEGRVELRPGGESKIGGWRLGRRSLYYTMKEVLTWDSNGNLTRQEPPLYSGEIGNRYGYYPYHRDFHTPRNADYAKYHEKDIKYLESGILISANPSYISIKGRPLIGAEISEDDNGNLKNGDAIEMQFDPKTPTVFTIFRHNGELRKNNPEDNTGSRTFLAGINSKGQLKANAVGTAGDTPVQTTMYVGNTRAFLDDTTASNPGPNYHGGIFEAGDESDTFPFFRAFVHEDDVKKKDGLLHIDGGRSSSGYSVNQYIRPIAIHGKYLALYAEDGTTANNHNLTTDTNFVLNRDSMVGQLGKFTNFQLKRGASEKNEFNTAGEMSVIIGAQTLGEQKNYKNLSIGAAQLTQVYSGMQTANNGKYTMLNMDTYELSSYKKITVQKMTQEQPYGELTIDEDIATFGLKNPSESANPVVSLLTLNRSANSTWFVRNHGIDIKATESNGNISIMSDYVGTGNAQSADYRPQVAIQAGQKTGNFAEITLASSNNNWTSYQGEQGASLIGGDDNVDGVPFQVRVGSSTDSQERSISIRTNRLLSNNTRVYTFYVGMSSKIRGGLELADTYHGKTIQDTTDNTVHAVSLWAANNIFSEKGSWANYFRGFSTEAGGDGRAAFCDGINDGSTIGSGGTASGIGGSSSCTIPTITINTSTGRPNLGSTTFSVEIPDANAIYNAISGSIAAQISNAVSSALANYVTVNSFNDLKNAYNNHRHTFPVPAAGPGITDGPSS